MKYTEDDITKNMGLVIHIAKRMRRLENSGAMEFRDLISEGILGLIHALDRFDESKGFKFSSYAGRCISGYMLRGHRKLHMEQWKAMQSRYDVPSTKISMYTTFDDGEEREVVGMDDQGESSREMFDYAAGQHILDKLLPHLTSRQRQVFTMIRDGLEVTEIAPLLGVTRQCVSQTLQLGIKNAQNYLAGRVR
jgi:RNA polymerase sigma factor (sigma-70 family)